LLAASLVLALGYNGLVFRWVQRWIPLMGMFQFPVKFVILTLTAAPLLAAGGLAQYEKQTPGGRRGWRLEFGWGAAMLGMIGVIVWVAWRRPLEGSSWTATAANGLWRVLFLLLTALALWLFVSRPAWRRWSIVPLLAVSWLDVLTHEPWQNPTVTPRVYQQGLAALDAKFKNTMPDIAQSRLMISPYAAGQLYYHPARDPKTSFLRDRAVFMADCNLLDDLPKVDGFFSINLRESDKVLLLLNSRAGRKLDSLQDLLSVSQTIAPGALFDWVARTNYIPIVSLGQGPVFADGPAALEAIDKDTADFRTVVYLPMEAKAAIQAVREPRARILAKEFTPARQSIEVETPAPTMVVLCQAYYHNWQASVDGVPVPLWRANYAFQALETPAGRHHILLVYTDKAFRLGGAISLASILLCAGGWLLWRRPAAG
jgi:hypothetical protein